MPAYTEFLQAGETCCRESFNGCVVPGIEAEFEKRGMSDGGNKPREICRSNKWSDLTVIESLQIWQGLQELEYDNAIVIFSNSLI